MREVIYLAGAIRNGVPEDIEWRNAFRAAMGGRHDFLNPCDGKKWHRGDQDEGGKLLSRWSQYGEPCINKDVFAQDVHNIKRCTVVVANMLAFDTGYPMVGTFMELGMAHMDGKLIYVITENPRLVEHPFVEGVAARVFPNVERCGEYLKQMGSFR